MTNGRKLTAAAFAIFATLVGSQAHAAQCGNGAGGFEVWKQQFAGEARAKGVGANAISALMGTSYAQATVNADRSLHSFKLSLDAFMAKRGAPAIVARGRAL
jgi:membrane-bound lytic murein transglycosylase B